MFKRAHNFKPYVEKKPKDVTEATKKNVQSNRTWLNLSKSRTRSYYLAAQTVWQIHKLLSNCWKLAVPLGFVFALLGVFAVGRISGYGAAQALGCVPQAKALSSVAQVQAADVEDVFQTGGVRGVRSQERLQCYRTKKKKKLQPT